MGGRGSGSGDSLGAIRNSATYKQEYERFVQQDLESSRLALYYDKSRLDRQSDADLAWQIDSDREVFGESPIKSINDQIADMKEERREVDRMIKNYDQLSSNGPIGTVPKETLVAEKDALSEGIRMREAALPRLTSDGVRREYRKLQRQLERGEEILRVNPNYGRFR